MFQISQIPNLAFGAGAWKQLSSLVPKYGKNVLLLTGKSSFLKSKYASPVMDSLKANSTAVYRESIENEPLVSDIDNIVECYSAKEIDLIVSIGGGSVVDAGKAIAAMLCEEGSVVHYLEGVGDRLPSGRRKPFVVLPTTAGTGSEATKNAVISKMGPEGFKKSLRHNGYIPDHVIISPELALDCPPSVTAASGMDALTQLIESYLSTRSNVFTDMLALEGIGLVFKSIEKAVFNGSSIEAREDMSLAAYLSGITLANAGLGVVHGFAQPLGSLFPVPHGVVCGTLMGVANRITLEKAIAVSNNELINKMATLGRLLSNEKEDIELSRRFVEHIEDLTEKLEIPKLGRYGVSKTDFDTIIDHTGLKNHPVNLDRGDLQRMLADRV